MTSLPVESPVTIEEEYLFHHHYDAQLEKQSRRGWQGDNVRLSQVVDVDVQTIEEVLGE